MTNQARERELALGGGYYQTTYRHSYTTTTPTHHESIGNYQNNCREIEIQDFEPCLSSETETHPEFCAYATSNSHGPSLVTRMPAEGPWGSSNAGYEDFTSSLSHGIVGSGLEQFENVPNTIAGFGIPATHVDEVEPCPSMHFPIPSAQQDPILLGFHNLGLFDEAFLRLHVRDNGHPLSLAIPDSYSSAIPNRSRDSASSPDSSLSIKSSTWSLAPSTSQGRSESDQNKRPLHEFMERRYIDSYRKSRSPTTLSRIERRGKGRTGRLSPEKRKKVHEVRTKGACLLCYLSKAPCDVRHGSTMCRKCQNKSFSLGNDICIRENLIDYCRLLYPPLLKGPLEDAVVRRLTLAVQQRFTQNYLEVQLTCGLDDTCLNVRVAEFVPQTEREASVAVISRRTKDSHPGFVHCRPAPLAFRCEDIDNILEQCQKHVELVVKQQKLISSVAKDEVTRKLFEAIGRYHCSAFSTKNNELLEKAAMLSYIQYFLATTITYTAPFAEQVHNLMSRPSSAYWATRNISALLNRQVKYAMNALFVKLTGEVLQALDKELKKRAPASWATCFSTICILFFCVEQTQIAAHGIVMHKKIHQRHDNPPSIAEGVEACHRLEFKPVSHLMDFFHGVYYSRKSLRAKGVGRVCNPIRDQVGDIGLDEASLALALEVRNILGNNWQALNQRVKTPAYHQGYGSLTEHMQLREQNSGRLVANFLLSFKAFGEL